VLDDSGGAPSWWRRVTRRIRVPGATRRQQRWATAATRLLTAALRADVTGPDGTSRMTALAPHAQALVQHLDGRSTDFARLQTSISSLAAKMRDAGELAEAFQLIEQIVRVRRRVLGTEHPDTLASTTDLAATLSAAGNHDAALTLMEQTVRTRRRIHGEDHPETVAAMSDLAVMLRRAGRLASAEELMKQTLHTRRQLLGENHPETVATASDLAEVLHDVDQANMVFVNIARRTEALATRTLNLLDELENDEEDPDRLARLFRLDHLVTRLRRANHSTLVFTATRSSREYRRAVDIVDVARAAQAEIEQYTRVELTSMARDVQIPGRMVVDLIHLLAELLDNATAFSPPETVVRVSAWRTYDGQVIVQIEDSGLGMSYEQMRELEQGITSPPPAHQVGAGGRMGMAIVARLAARHGIGVEFSPRNGGGTVAMVTLP
jgi:signal transduction histidine kinase